VTAATAPAAEMRAVYVEDPDPGDPLAALVVGTRPVPRRREGWTRVQVRAVSLNHHDVFSLRGVGLTPDLLPMVLGCDAAGIDERGRPVVVHSVVTSEGWDGPPLLDPRLTILSERAQGTLAEYLDVPSENLVEKPEELSFEEAACLPTAWVTAYHMLFCQAGLSSGDRLLVQGASGGLAAAVVALATGAGVEVWLTSRDPAAVGHLGDLGTGRVLGHGERVPDRVDAVLDGIGSSTWAHSLRSLRPGGTLVAVGGTSGFSAEVDIARVVRHRFRIVGSMMGSKDDLQAVVDLCRKTGIRPAIDAVVPFAEVSTGFDRLLAGALTGKVVVTF
jgi:NADPH:quinone reductase-like Zn-dependent oxidoreductase